MVQYILLWRDVHVLADLLGNLALDDVGNNLVSKSSTHDLR